MTSGTSLQDLVHQALDQAAYVTGWSSADQKDGEHQQPAPGNHPDDPDATVNQPSSKDTEPKANGEARPEAEGQGPEDGTSRALGNEGPIGKALGSNLTEGIKRQLEGKEDNHPGERDEEAAADGVGANTDQVQSKEPEADAAKNQPEKGEADMAAQDHDGERGAIWASRPNEEQAQKVKEQKQKGQAGSAPPSKGSGAATLGADNQKSRPRVSDAPSANGSSRSGLTSLLGGGQAQKLPMSPQSSARRSRWTENNRGLRSAFDSAEDGSEGEPSAIKSNDSATPGQASAGPGTPSTPAAGKMRAISNILIGSQRGQPGGDTTPPDGQTSKGGQAEEGAPAEGDDTVAGRTGAPGQTAGAAKWSALKNKLRNNNAKAKADTAKTRASQTDLTRELQSG